VDQKAFHDLISGKTKGLAPSLLKGLLWFFSRVYGLMALTRNTLYSNGVLRSHCAPCPVICIGNLTTGGTGKTPLVAWLCRHLSEHKKLNCTILTRGYKSSHTQTDEPAMLKRQLGNTQVVRNANRLEGIKTALARGPVDVFVMDDGFQHQRLARDLNILTLDATNPFGYEKLLPAGLLRESVTAIRRAQCAVITRSDQISGEGLKTLTKTIKSICPAMIIASTVHSPRSVHFSDNTIQPTSWLNGRSVFAFCGIGNPQAFFFTLEQVGAKLVGTHVFDDHYHCTDEDLGNLHETAIQNHADILLTTEKNFPDIQAINTSTSIPVGYLSVELVFQSGEDQVKELIEQALDSKISQT